MNRNLTASELESARELLAEIRAKLHALSGGDKALRFALNRKVFKELSYDERESPAYRRRLKALKRKDQKGICPHCSKPLPELDAVLDRIRAVEGYTSVNTRLLCPDCDRKIQAERGFT
jgi:hypothetical protein